MISLNRKMRDGLKASLHRLFMLGQRFGVDVLPRHFYSNIPDIRELRRTLSWRNPQSMIGISGAEIEPQLRFLQGCCMPFQERLRGGRIHECACRENGEPGYGSVEADVLFCFVAGRRPRRIVQVGAGVSTAVILSAAKEAGYTPEIVCIDPFPNRYLIEMAKNRRIEIIPEKAEHVDLDILTAVRSGDFLFIDSTHAMRPGSEVNRIVLEVLPRLPDFSFVHFHDIYFPYDYQSSTLTGLSFGGESTLLQAFLVNNSRYSIALSLSMLHHACPREMQSVLPNYEPAEMEFGLCRDGSGHFPSATYLAVS
jgi:hypothetical protein